MSAGCVHQKASVILAAGFMAGGLIVGDLPSAIQYGIGALIGIVISPDQDVDGGNISNAIIRNRLGSWAERGWDVLWYLYRKSLKHGSPLSHYPVVSTVLRLAYLFVFLLVLPLGMVELVAPDKANMGSILSTCLWKILQHWQVIIGLMGSDFIHWGLDKMTKENANNPNKQPCRPLRLPTFTARSRA